jgi:molybdopterin synthase catalytic subunit
MTLAAIRAEPLSIDEVYQAVVNDAQGGVVVFVGRVRNHNQGQAITQLEYEAYASMAEKEMRRIMEAINGEHPGAVLACTHRAGTLGVGDLAVVCAASAPHRAEAFEACRKLIDRVKETVPVWKREHGPDGPYWVDFQPAGG